MGWRGVVWCGGGGGCLVGWGWWGGFGGRVGG